MCKYLIAALLICVLVSGVSCQSVTQRQYYEPTQQTQSVGSDGLTRGAVKSQKGKNGIPDFSQNKSFSFNLLNL